MRLSTLTTSSDAIRVFPVRNHWTPTDDGAFVGEPPALSDRFAMLDKSRPVCVSVTFTWHKAMAEQIAAGWRVHFRDVRVGGPAFEDAGGEFTPGMFLKAGCTITSRGCPKKCGWCSVPKREGAIRELTIKPGYIVQDNNLLACSEKHLRAVFDMLREQGRSVSFNGGLDKHFLKEWHRELFDSVPINEMWFACDVFADLPQMERVARIFSGYSPDKLRCYTMIGYDTETPEEADWRCDFVHKLGFKPFCQLFQPIDAPLKVYNQRWREVHRKWARPAAYGAKHKPTRQGDLFSLTQGA